MIAIKSSISKGLKAHGNNVQNNDDNGAIYLNQSLIEFTLYVWKWQIFSCAIRN